MDVRVEDLDIADQLEVSDFFEPRLVLCESLTHCGLVFRIRSVDHVALVLEAAVLEVLSSVTKILTISPPALSSGIALLNSALIAALSAITSSPGVWNLPPCLIGSMVESSPSCTR
jgi:hypothetical protein